MLPILVLALVVWPFVEILVALQVASAVGILPTVGALVALSFLGTVLLRRQGTSAMVRVRAAWRAGRLPAPEFVDGAVGVSGAVLLMIPGFASAVVGLLLLLPPVRFAVPRGARGRMERRHRVLRRRRQRPPRAEVVTVDAVARGAGATSVIRQDDDLEDEFFGDALPTGPVAIVPDVPGVPLPPPPDRPAAAPGPPGVAPDPTPAAPPVPDADDADGEVPDEVPLADGPVDLDIPDRRFRKRRGGGK